MPITGGCLVFEGVDGLQDAVSGPGPGGDPGVVRVQPLQRAALRTGRMCAWLRAIP